MIKRILTVMLLSIGFSVTSDAQCKAIDLINEYRAEKQLEPLKEDLVLVASAAVRCDEIQDYFSHTRPSGQPWYTVDPDNMYGENLASGYTTNEDVVQAWIDSPPHEKNISNPQFKRIAIVVNNKYWACEFGY